MNTPNDHQPLTPLERRSRAWFDDSVANLDAHTRSRLNQARQAALHAAQRPAAVTARWLMPLGSVAALALIAMVSLHFMSGGSTPAVQSGSGMEDMEIVASADNLELLQNDVEFYDWLETSDEAAITSEAT